MLPVISGKECVKALEGAVFYVRRIKSSHIIMRKDSPIAQVVVPNHNTLDRGTLRGIINKAGLTLNDFVMLLK
ncbi:MAG TPA: type II toxin-antitoxin system HicA family toxin [candidate division Zixibacteria bacterium]|nr:type II toxin-antitoxin system HicA family toxin [candidate division Zixibacteria bacterium]